MTWYCRACPRSTRRTRAQRPPKERLLLQLLEALKKCVDDTATAPRTSGVVPPPTDVDEFLADSPPRLSINVAGGRSPDTLPDAMLHTQNLQHEQYPTTWSPRWEAYVCPAHIGKVLASVKEDDAYIEWDALKPTMDMLVGTGRELVDAGVTYSHDKASTQSMTFGTTKVMALGGKNHWALAHWRGTKTAAVVEVKIRDSSESRSGSELDAEMTQVKNMLNGVHQED